MRLRRLPLLLSLIMLLPLLSGCDAKTKAFIQQLVQRLQPVLQGMMGGTGALTPTSGTGTNTYPGSLVKQPSTGMIPIPGSGVYVPGTNSSGALPPGAPGQGLNPADSGSVPAGAKVYKVLASSFSNQRIAGTTDEDGDSNLESGERGVALPSRRGLGKWVTIRYNGRVANAKVIDVGPWYTDDPYWETGTVPKAQANKGGTRRGTLDGNSGSQVLTINGACIDLTPQTWKDLGGSGGGMAEVEWWFSSPAQSMPYVMAAAPRAPGSPSSS